MNRFIRYVQPVRGGFFPAYANGNRWPGFDTDANQFLEAALANFAASASAPRLPVDLYEDKDNTYVRAIVPGATRESLSIELVDGHLNLAVQRQDGEKSFNLPRSISLPESVQADKVSATYENGVLTVTLPKQEQAKPRKIDVTVN